MSSQISSRAALAVEKAFQPFKQSWACSPGLLSWRTGREQEGLPPPGAMPLTLLHAPHPLHGYRDLPFPLPSYLTRLIVSALWGFVRSWRQQEAQGQSPSHCFLDMMGSTSGHLVRDAGLASRPNAVFFLSVPVGLSWEVVLTLLYISRSWFPLSFLFSNTGVTAS